MGENLKDILLSLLCAGLAFGFVKIFGINSEDFLVFLVGMIAYFTYRNYEESL
jgi:hypothetical protein